MRRERLWGPIRWLSPSPRLKATIHSRSDSRTPGSRWTSAQVGRMGQSIPSCPKDRPLRREVGRLGAVGGLGNLPHPLVPAVPIEFSCRAAVELQQTSDALSAFDLASAFSPCAGPSAPISGERGVNLVLVVRHVENQRHLPIVELKPAA